MKIGRNDPCFCGSGKKYKKCCLGKVVPSAELDYERVSLTYDHLVEKLFKFMEKRFGSLAIILAMEEFYCWSEDFYERLEEAGEGVADWLDEILEEHAQCFIPWFLFNWTYDPDCDDDELLTSTTPVFQTVAECYVEEKKSRLDEGERSFIAATNQTPFSFYEVLSCIPGEGFKLRDIVLEVDIDVRENEALEMLDVGDILWARVSCLEEINILSGTGSIFFPPRLKPVLLNIRQSFLQVDRTINNDTLNEYDDTLRQIYLDSYESFNATPELVNTDGEKLLFHTLHYEINQPEAVFKKIVPLAFGILEEELREDFVTNTDGQLVSVTVPWLVVKDEDQAMGMDNIIFANMKIDGRNFTVEVNSGVRAEKARRELKSRLGELAVYQTTVVQSLETMDVEVDSESDFGEEVDFSQRPEVQEKLQEMMARHWKGWTDTALPALGGQTPRQAVKTAVGRESVAALLLDAEKMHDESDPISIIQRPLILEARQRLGIPSDQACVKSVATSRRQNESADRVEILKKILDDFGRDHLDPVNIKLVHKLCERIARLKSLNINRGKIEIWAAAIIYVIARINFLFDPEQGHSLTRDEVHAFFKTKATTVGNKAGMIQKTCDITYGDEDFCRPEIIKKFSFRLSEDGLILPPD